MIWDKHFAPKIDSKEVIQVPVEWINFLSVTLLSPDKFDWAKKFISSKVWEIITQNKENDICLPFAIPEACPVSHSLSCLLDIPQEQENTPNSKGESQETSASSTSALHQNRKRKEKGPLVETEVRRSCRLQKMYKGFKKAVCLDKGCLACHSFPPPLPAKIVKNLNTSFCKVNAQDSAEDKLTFKNKKTKTSNKAKEGSIAAKELNKNYIVLFSAIMYVLSQICLWYGILYVTLLLLGTEL